jgi:NADH dehydrogenase
MKVLVLGGKGFIGRHAVAALGRAGATITIGTRMPSTVDAEYAEERHVLHQDLTPAYWADVARRFDVILNCVGILRQRVGETYESVHHLAPRAIAGACKNEGTRFVHVSALGLSPGARSRFLTSKVRGEDAIQHSDADWYLARLSLLDGEGGYGASWLRGVSRLPVFVVPTSATGRIAALTAEDAGEALANLCLGSSKSLGTDRSRVYELGGEHPVPFEDYIRGLRRRYSNKPALALKVPGLLARAGAHICDVLHFSPFSFGHWELLCHDNVPKPNRLRALLGREPHKVL